jgi:hypothetical protein
MNWLLGLFAYKSLFPGIAYLLAMVAVFAWIKISWQRYSILFLMVLLPMLSAYKSFEAVRTSDYWQREFENSCKNETTNEITATAQDVIAVRQYIDPYPNPNPLNKGLFPFLIDLDRVNGYSEVEQIYDPKNGYGVRRIRGPVPWEPKEERNPVLKSRYGLEWEEIKPVSPNNYFSGAVLVIKDYSSNQVMARQKTFALHSPDIFLYRDNMVFGGSNMGIILKSQRYLTCPSAMELHEFVYKVLRPKWE